jgi:hypothetical protein
MTLLENEKLPSKIYSSIKQRTKKTSPPMSIMSKREFITWYNKQQPKKCAYCGCTEEEVKEFNNKVINKRKTRGNRLEIDRIEDDKGYTLKNCCLACYWCNNAKTDTFLEEDMKLIGKAIGTIIKKNIKQK